MQAKLNNRWAVVFMLWTVCFLSYADRQVIFVLLPLLKKEFQLNGWQVGLLSASFMVMYAVMGPFAGWISDRISRRWIILCALLVWSGTTLLTSLATHYVSLVAALALAGLGEAFYFPSAMSLISDYHGPKTRSRAMALHQSGVYVGSIVGGWLAGLIGQHSGWRSGFRWFGAAGILVAVVLACVLREPPRGLSDEQPVGAQRTSLLQGFQALLANPVARVLVLVFICANFVAMVFSVWMPTYLYVRFHLSLSLAGLSASAYTQMASIVGVLIGGVAADKWVAKSQDSSARLRVMALGLLFALPAVTLSGWTESIALLFGAMVVFGLGRGVYESNLWCSLYDTVPISRRGSALGIMNALGWLGAAAAEMLIGTASGRFGLGSCFSATAAIYFVAALLLLFAARRMRGAGSNQTSAI